MRPRLVFRRRALGQFADDGQRIFLLLAGFDAWIPELGQTHAIPLPADYRPNDLQAGYSAEGIIREYPILTKRDIGAALAHEEKLAKRA